MANFKRYTLNDQDDNGDMCEGYMAQDDEGDYVKFDDIKDLLSLTADFDATKRVHDLYLDYRKQTVGDTSDEGHISFTQWFKRERQRMLAEQDVVKMMEEKFKPSNKQNVQPPCLSCPKHQHASYTYCYACHCVMEHKQQGESIPLSKKGCNSGQDQIS